MSNPAQGAVGAETMTAGQVEALAKRLHEANPGAPLLAWDGLWEPMRQNYRTMARAALASPRADSDERTAGVSAEAMLLALDRFDLKLLSRDVEPRDDDTWAVIDTKTADPEANWPGELVSEHATHAEARVALMRAALASATPAQPAGAVPDSLRALSEAAEKADNYLWAIGKGKDPSHIAERMRTDYRKSWLSANRYPADYTEANAWEAKHRLAEALLASHPAGQSAGSGADAFSGKFWLHLKEPRCVPDRKGPFRSRDLAKTLREVMAARPQAYISVVTVSHDGPAFEDGPQALQVTDGRSMSTGSKHIERVRAAHGDHSDLPAPDSTRTGDEGTERLREAVSKALHDNQFLDGWPEMVDPVVEAVLAARPAAPEASSLPDDCRLIQAEMPSAVMERMASNLSDEFGPDFVAANKAFALAVYAEAFAAGVRPAVPEAQGAERVRHVKRGSEYEVLGEAEAQISDGESDRFGNWKGLYEGDKLTVYRGSDGKLWCRFTDEFRDGRFVPAPPASSGQGGR